jgi:hypothetical protein
MLVWQDAGVVRTVAFLLARRCSGRATTSRPTTTMTCSISSGCARRKQRRILQVGRGCRVRSGPAACGSLARAVAGVRYRVHVRGDLRVRHASPRAMQQVHDHALSLGTVHAGRDLARTDRDKP